MLQPLWESRDRYEELKQLDDAAKEVTRAAWEGWRSSWREERTTPRPGRRSGGAPGPELISIPPKSGPQKTRKFVPSLRPNSPDTPRPLEGSRRPSHRAVTRGARISPRLRPPQSSNPAPYVSLSSLCPRLTLLRDRTAGQGAPRRTEATIRTLELTRGGSAAQGQGAVRSGAVSGKVSLHAQSRCRGGCNPGPRCVPVSPRGPLLPEAHGDTPTGCPATCGVPALVRRCPSPPGPDAARALSPLPHTCPGPASAAPHTPPHTVSATPFRQGSRLWGPRPCCWEPPCPAEHRVVSQAPCVALVPQTAVCTTRHQEPPAGRWAIQTRSRFLESGPSTRRSRRGPETPKQTVQTATSEQVFLARPPAGLLKHLGVPLPAREPSL